jgi:hypothetical protein
MRLGVLCLGLLAAVAAHGQRNKDDDTAAAKRACGVEDCFLERDVRDFEVIDQTHLIVYTGAQRCAFHVELRGALCDLSFAPELYFSRTNEVPDGRLSRAGDSLGRGIEDPFDPFTTARRERRDLRICSNDLGIQVHGGRFTESPSSNLPADRFGNPRTDCRISSVTSITDDQLVEFYVGRGVVPPLPPMGTGQIEVGEQEESATQPESAPGAEAAEQATATGQESAR